MSANGGAAAGRTCLRSATNATRHGAGRTTCSSPATWRHCARAWSHAAGACSRKPQSQPVLPATLDGHPEALLLLRQGRDERELLAIRLWPAPARLHDGTPLWLGTTQTLHFVRPFDAFGLWLPAEDRGVAHVALRDALDGYALRESSSPAAPVPVLRARRAD